ncbi:MAG: MBL fold metallo-hydrolase [Pseudomonadota bacterium]
MDITFWGTRGSIAAPGRDTLTYGGNTTCLEVTLSSGRTVIVDAGTGIRCLGTSIMERQLPLDLDLIITHIHWDHIMGFPFFAPVYQESATIRVDGCRRAITGLKNVFASAFVDGTWPIKFDDLRAKIEPVESLLETMPGGRRIDDTEIRQHRLHHPQGGIGLRFSESGGSFVFLTDNELSDDGWKGASFDDFVEFCRGADVLVHDCQYFPEEMPLRKGWGHSDSESVARLAVESGIGKLYLFHHDPWRKDDDVAIMVGRCRDALDRLGAVVEVEGAREGDQIKI